MKIVNTEDIFLRAAIAIVALDYVAIFALYYLR